MAERETNGWTRLALDRAFEDQQRQIDDMKNTIDALAALPTEMARAITRLEDLGQGVEDLKSWIGDVETRVTGHIGDVEVRVTEKIDDLRGDVDDEVGGRRKNRVLITIAVIGACATVLAALITATVTLFGGG